MVDDAADGQTFVDVAGQVVPTLGGPVDIDGLPLPKHGGMLMRTYVIPSGDELQSDPQNAAVEVPIKEGELILLTGNGQCLDVNLRLLDVGMHVVRAKTQKSLWRSLSPFVTMAEYNFEEKDKSFLSHNEKDDVNFYFLCCGTEAIRQRDRDEWLDCFSSAVQRLTSSLFPAFHIMTYPAYDAPWTKPRIMAGYLLRLEDSSNSLSLVYCELQAPTLPDQGTSDEKADNSGDYATLTMYANELCMYRLCSARIYKNADAVSWRGVNCKIFGIDGCCLAARCEEEKRVWLRAVSNVKVKLSVDAPAPSPQELEVFREAVLERISHIKDAGMPEVPCPPMLPTMTIDVSSSVETGGRS
eukprot:CAMPEP_0178466924 /NCGR_PEP_ID=MMETSP0689_2-20121128/52152_1 /TAXON_ID=160604 /ORGANISM="Amphidinium massartii, Strain CS-259" /LENGTH=355 /DNA_ID=CAMNT_0020093959 /DNA_START=102 /DNA_END=1169 /DNA_ORIENTATION=-